MFIMRESIWWLLATGLVGYVCGYAKGRPGWGLLLGLLFGPFGCLAIMLIPPLPRRPLFGGRVHAFRSGGAPGSAGTERPEADGSGCPRCRKPVSGRAKACPHCGNVLLPIRYAVEGGPSR